MGKQNGKGKQKQKQKRIKTAVATANDPNAVRHNLLACGCAGCYIADKDSEWILGERALGDVSAPSAADDDPFAQVDIHQDEHGVIVVSVNNLATTRRAIYVSAKANDPGTAVVLHDRRGKRLQAGKTAGEANEFGAAELYACVTFVIILDPKRAMDVAQWDGADGVEMAKLSFELKDHPEAECDAAAATFDQFPLGGDGPFLCTQGEAGRLTHFFPESYHAFDLRCSEGTPVLALADGIIVDVSQTAHVTGVHCHNLTEWNSIGIEVDGGLLIEYVHIRPGSSLVKVGDSVSRGQEICKSGKVGFSPEPHIHIEAHRVANPTGPSVRIHLVDADGHGYVPTAGALYSPAGRVDTCIPATRVTE